MATFSSYDRKQNISQMQDEVFDLAIIGGGITGAGVARDAASRGMKVALVEAKDFASGTSSKSSKLIHGGIRYLENLEFHLVFEALAERRLLFEIAPHLVHPLRFVLPLYKGGRVGMTKLGLGMWLYDALALFDVPEMHERLDAEGTCSRISILNSQDLLGSYVYSDAYMDDDRLVIETLRSASAYGAKIANYVSVKEASYNGSKVNSILCYDHESQKNFSVRAKHFVGSVGPWTDIFGTEVLKKWDRQLKPTKGVHLTFRRDRLKLDSAVVMISDDEKRIVFAIPRHEMIIIGTTDTDFNQNPNEVHTDQQDVDYILKIAQEYFPGAQLKKEDIIASYSGIRPLIDDQSDFESKRSREHKIWYDDRGITFVAGGKYTTYRRMAHQVVDACLDHFSPEDIVKFKDSQTTQAINPLVSLDCLSKAKASESEWISQFNSSQEEVRFLTDRHGLEAEDLLKKKQKYNLGTLWEAEAYHAIENTMCLHLKDFFLRRTPLFLSEKDHGRKYFEPISKIFAEHFGWSESERQREIEDTQKAYQFEMQWR